MNIMLDSGAFSAWVKNLEINIENYTDFVLDNINIFSYVVNLDVIPGAWGKTPTEKEADEAASIGWSNYKYMVKRGVPENKIIHVFHQNENFKWLEKFVKNGLNYIGLSPANDRINKEKIQWLDKCMNYVTDKKGMPLNKWHGFAVTSLNTILRYPWYSVDSSSWAVISRMGAIFVPRFRKGEWIYDEQSWEVGVSTKSPHRHDRTKHIDNLSPKHRELIEEYIHTKGYKIGSSHIEKVSPDYKPKQGKELWYKKGKSIEVIDEVGLSNSHRQRNEINILYFQDLANSLPEWPWPFKIKQKKGFLS